MGYEHANEGHLLKLGITDLKNGHGHVSYNASDSTVCQ